MVNIKKLKCGITLITEKMENFNSASIGIWVKAGAVNETPDISGISHYIEHMLFKGTKNRTAKEIAEDVDKIGGQINAFTGKEVTCYYIKSLASNLDKSIDILIDMFKDSIFDEEEMEREKQVIYEEMNMIQDSPDEDAHDTLCEIIFEGNPIGNSIIGTKKSLKKIKRDDITDYINNQYTKDSILISVAGNFDEKAIIDIIEGKLSKRKARKKKVDFGKAKYKPNFKVKVKDIEQTHLCIGTKSIKLDGKEYYSYSLLNNILGGTMSSRLFQNIREQKGLAYSIYSMNNSLSEDGFFNIYGGVSHEKIKEAIEGIKEELYILGDKGVEREELEKAKEQSKSTYIFGQENVNSRMFYNGKSYMLLNKIIPQEEVMKEIDMVSEKDIEKASKKICDIKNYSAVAVTNKKVQLKKYMQG